ncbi:uncharacterized protein PHACADRAFT_197216 [Phanerochaete carnosa HHB-10118-sp]|uniref:NACHT domain-containing protein n=1 Tax=Phanerochaete carnosa (strain HHB-10118-sp) TaxID=650164 RepID=K5UXH9_PHACS|nr:uncharacterized protein PHACADRAFT_197216 [Phanerochaete carnosa HHB-10118-sp]EKM54786.1 hypothetical protein PHACADRAFT_197216 [Phanerochaete carnosa HHB-10118-sp]
MSTPNTQSELGGQGPSASSSRFQELWDEAFLEYKKVTGSDLLRSPLYNQIQKAESSGKVARILKEHKSNFKAFRAHGEKIRAIIAPIFTLTKLFTDTGREIAAASSVVPGGQAIFAAFGVFLEAFDKVSEQYDALEELLSRLGGVLGRLDNHLQACSALNDQLEGVFVRALVQLLNVFAICTKYIKKQLSERTARAVLTRMKDYGRALLGNKDVKDALEKLDELTKEELLATTAQTLDVVQGVASEIKLVSGDIREIKDNVSDLRGIGAKVLDLYFEKDIRDWLAPPDPSQNHEERRTSYLDGTCTWFFDHKFKEWKDSSNGVYWIYGNPGAGKSVLCSSVVEHISSIPGLHVAYFYFDYRRAEMQTVTGLLASLIYQLAICAEHRHQVLEQFYVENRSKLKPTRELLLSCLEQILQASTGTVIIIDALDECPHTTRRDELFFSLQKLVSRTSGGYVFS